MKRHLITLAMCLAAVLALSFGCDWEAPPDSAEEEEEFNCSQNPGFPGYDCADACCNWDQCEGERQLSLMYDSYNGCVNRCDEALYIEMDAAIQNEKFKNCVLDCIADCGMSDDCREDCAEMYPD